MKYQKREARSEKREGTFNFQLSTFNFSLSTQHSARSTPPRRRGGFTLLELVLVLSMAAMLLLSLYMSLSIGMRARDSANAAVEPMRAASIAMDLVRRDFEGVLNPNGTYAGQFEGYHQPGPNNGDLDGADFYSIGSDGYWNSNPLSEGIRHIEFYVDQQTAPPVLMRRITRNLITTNQPQIEEEVLCRSIRSFGLRFFDGSDWRDDWDSPSMGDILPEAVEITLEIETPPIRQDQQPGTYLSRRIMPLPTCKTSQLPGLGGTGGF